MDIKIAKDKKGNVESISLTDVTFYYTNVRKPTPVYDDRKLSYDKARKEYKITVAINEEIADQWDEIFTKQPSKKWTNDKFRENFKLDEDDALPCPGEKKQFTIKIAQRELKSDGTPASQPRVFERDEQGKPVEITNDKNVGNGSKGNIKIRVIQNDYGNFAYPDKMIVTSLVEYADSVGGLSEDDLEFLGVESVDDVVTSDTKRTTSNSVTEDDDDAGETAPWENDNPDDY